MECKERTGMWAWKHPHSADGSVSYTELTGDVVFENVTFGYNEDKVILKNISLYAKPGQKLYDVMLDTYEKGFNMEMLDPFFELMKGKIVPLLKESAERSKMVPDAFLSADYPEAAQAEVARFLAEYEGFDFDRGVLALSAHPFTTNLHNHDVRIMTHYQKRIDSSIFSVLHETGHAIYEFGIRDD